MTHTQRRPVARGVVDPRKPGYRAIIVRVEDELFALVRDRAVKHGTSFGEQVRILLEWGLEEAGKE